jgi:ferredoxin
MTIDSTKLIYFSPTGTTKKVVESIVQGIQAETVEHLNLTPPEAETRKFNDLYDELVIIGAPVYSGRLPTEAVQRLQHFKAFNTPAVVVVVYGNREYEDALLELTDLAVEAGFKPFAGGAFIGEHSFANEKTPIANGRPDEEDIKKAIEFGKMVRGKLEESHELDQMPPVKVPGNFPYKKRSNRTERSPISPSTQETLCTTCGKCATVCPVAAITVVDTVMTDQNTCILCCACVKNCPTGARVMDHPQIKPVAEWLSTKCRARKEPEMYV